MRGWKMDSIGEQVAQESLQLKIKTALDICSMIPRTLQGIKEIQASVDTFFRSGYSTILASNGQKAVAEFVAADFSYNGRSYGEATLLLRIARDSLQELETLIGNQSGKPSGPLSANRGSGESDGGLIDWPRGWGPTVAQAAELEEMAAQMVNGLGKPNRPRLSLETILDRIADDMGGEIETAAQVVHLWTQEWATRDRKKVGRGSK
jgi:hypothetical protein